MTESVRIEQATTSDIAAVERITREAYAPYVQLLDRHPTPVHDDYQMRIERGEVHVLRIGDALAGLVVAEDKPTTLLIHSLVVSPREQGKGLGQMLLTFCETRAREMGKSELRLCTSDKMSRNLRIYNAYGFSEIGREKLNLGASPIVVWLEKRV